MDLKTIYNAFDVDEPLPADDTARYVDLAHVRGDSQISKKLLLRVLNSGSSPSHHLLMGHTKCGKTTELNRARRLLEQEGYATVLFDVADLATREFEYTTVLLLMVGQVIAQLGRRKDRPIDIDDDGANTLAEFLISKEITRSGEFSGDAGTKVDAKAGAGLLKWFLGELGLGLELRGGFKRSRDITVKLEADTRGFLTAVQQVISYAHSKVTDSGYRGLVVICDGCDKLAISATDEDGRSRDLQQSMFVDHAADLRSVPCNVIYTVPISVPINLGDVWEQGYDFVPAIPVLQLPGIDERYSREGREALTEVIARRLSQHKLSISDLFADPAALDQLIAVSGGHISDLLLLVREAVLEAQTTGAARLETSHIRRAIRQRASEYTRLIESSYLGTLVTIDQFKTGQPNSREYRELIFKRLVLEYVCGSDAKVDLHPLVAASDAYRRFRNPDVK
jgi:hypothetical protein